MTKEDISQTIAQFLRKAIQMDLVDPVDEIYLRNRLLDILQLEDYVETENLDEMPDLLDSMDEMIYYAVQNKLIEDYQYEKDILKAKIMNLVTPLPSVVNQVFWEKYKVDKEHATDYFYQLSQDNDYIKTRNISKNIFFETESPYGNLEITINLSKPEKDPKEISAQKDKVSMNYPSCALCLENEGYTGHANHAARENHRVIRMTIQDELYGMQYSPYVYYNEHCIFLNKTHKPMVVNQSTIEKLLEIIDLFPNYFVGSNADLPIVGGSILSHDHYQGGRYQFPIEQAQPIEEIKLVDYPRVRASVIQWPLSVLRLKSEHKKDLVEAVVHIMDTWKHYSDEDYEIFSHTGNTRHNTVTPIARFNEGLYEMDVVLRNNRATKEYPDGIFHPHPDVHHIKKENIGLIEVMGLAILPPRLEEEIEQIKEFLIGSCGIETVANIHKEWAQDLKNKYNPINQDKITDILKQEIGNKFTLVLEYAGVFKQTPKGLDGFRKFIKSLNK